MKTELCLTAGECLLRNFANSMVALLVFQVWACDWLRGLVHTRGPQGRYRQDYHRDGGPGYGAGLNERAGGSARSQQPGALQHGCRHRLQWPTC
ncbi:hypothetical protein V5799_025346 [Amblyomma americanum]|uniref:Uncharacterized protein n=1 Tax=Amblyomma americanum TaxID=6943 RepID=A0AAQ4E9U7_AMBAM